MNEDIIRMAREAKFHVDARADVFYRCAVVGSLAALQRFVDLVRADQRERDAAICKEHAADAWDHEGGALWCADAIRSQNAK